MTEMIERVVRALEKGDEMFECGTGYFVRASAILESVATDPDIQEILRWLDFKSCGWHPDEQTYKGARKLLEALQTEKTP